MGRTPNSSKPLEARERTRLIHEGAREWRVHLVVAGRAADTVYLCACDQEAAERLALALSRLEFAKRGGDSRELAEPLRRQDCSAILVEPVFYCAGSPERPDCGRVIITPDPRTARRPDGSPFEEPLGASEPGEVRCVSCGSAVHGAGT